MFSTLNEVKEFIKANDVKMIDFKMTDIDGRWRHILIPQQRPVSYTQLPLPTICSV